MISLLIKKYFSASQTLPISIPNSRIAATLLILLFSFTAQAGTKLTLSCEMKTTFITEYLDKRNPTSSPQPPFTMIYEFLGNGTAIGKAQVSYSEPVILNVRETERSFILIPTKNNVEIKDAIVSIDRITGALDSKGRINFSDSVTWSFSKGECIPTQPSNRRF